MTIESLYAALTRTLPATLCLLASGCTDADPATGPDPDPEDTTAPMVVSTTPTAAATAVGADAKIVITFSEQMDPATVEAAYASQQLPLDKVSMSWNADGTVLVISPDQPLAYAEGTGTDLSAVTPLAYGITIGAEAADLAGNPLGVALELTFSTKRRMAAAFGLISDLSRTALGGTLLGSSNDAWVGDNAVDNTYRSYLTFDLAALPATATIESASFSARQLPSEGAPYTIGAVNAYHLTFSTMNNVGAIAPMSFPGSFSEDGTSESKSIDVSSQVADDVAHRIEREHHSQYRLQIDTPTNANSTTDRAVFAKGTFEMSVVYVAD
jgi:hypothetical protein